MKIRLLAMVMICTVLAACNRGQVTDAERAPEGGVDVTAQLTEADIQEAVADALAIENPLLRDPKVDLQAGQIVVTGSHEAREGTGTVSGSFTLTLSVSNGSILAQITQVNIQGIELSDERIANINQRIAERVARRADRENRQITMKSVSVTDTLVEVVFNVQRA